MKKIMMPLAFLVAMTTSALAAQDHNSSRSNKTASVAVELGDDSFDFSKFLRAAKAGDYTSGALLNDANALEKKARTIRESMLLGTFANHLIESLKTLRCVESARDFDQCLNQALIMSEKMKLKK